MHLRSQTNKQTISHLFQIGWRLVLELLETAKKTAPPQPTRLADLAKSQAMSTAEFPIPEENKISL